MGWLLVIVGLCLLANTVDDFFRGTFSSQQGRMVSLITTGLVLTAAGVYRVYRARSHEPALARQAPGDRRTDAGKVTGPRKSTTWFQRHPVLFKVATGIAVVVLGLIVWGAVSSAYGTDFDNRLPCPWGELYYTDRVPQAEAQTIGTFLQTINNGRHAIPTSMGTITFGTFDAQLDKTGSVFELRLIPLEEYLADPGYPEDMRELGEELMTTAFPKNSITILLCNERFEPNETLGPFTAK